MSMAEWETSAETVLLQGSRSASTRSRGSRKSRFCEPGPRGELHEVSNHPMRARATPESASDTARTGSETAPEAANTATAEAAIAEAMARRTRPALRLAEANRFTSE